MGVLESRRCQPQIRGATFACAFACLLMCACTNGKGAPIIDISDEGGTALDSVSGGTGGAGGKTARPDAGSQTNSDVDTTIDEAPLNSECSRIAATWPTQYAADEQKLFSRINQLRGNPSELCPPPIGPQGPLERSSALDCAARMKFDDDVLRSMSGGGPAFNFAIRNMDGKFGDRARSAGARIDAETIFTNASNVDQILALLASDPSDAANFCYIASTWLPLVGIARRGNVWVLDFGNPGSPGPRGPGTSNPPNAGNSGPSNGGTGGR